MDPVTIAVCLAAGVYTLNSLPLGGVIAKLSNAVPKQQAIAVLEAPKKPAKKKKSPNRAK